MKFDEYGVGIYKILIIIFFVGLCFVLALPLFYNLDEAKDTETCINNMREVRTAVRQYMSDRNEIFTGTTRDLTRTGYLSSVFERCPSGRGGDNYFISVVRGEDGQVDIEIRCMLVDQHPNHVLD